jgi:hypothetical protein
VGRETIISFNTMCEKKANNKERQTQCKTIIIKKIGAKHDLGPLYRAIA